MKKENWVWMPHPGHFIGSRNCKFFLNTYVGEYIVSTVGEYWSDQNCRRITAEIYNKEWYEENKELKGDHFDSAYMKKFGYEDIGCDRKFETMVFKAKKTEHRCCPYGQLGEDIDFEAYNTAGEAYEGHLKLCNKWSKE